MRLAGSRVEGMTKLVREMRARRVRRTVVTRALLSEGRGQRCE